MKKGVILILFIFIAFGASSQIIGKQELKIAYYINFIRQISWENEAQIIDFNVIFYGDSIIYDKLKANVEGRTIRGKKILIFYTDSLIDFSKYQILIISKKKQHFLKTIYEKYYKNRLIISESNTTKNCMINIYESNDAYEFKINKKNIKEAGLEVSNILESITITDIDAMRNKLAETDNKLKEEQKIVKEQQALIHNQKEKINQQIDQIKQKEKEFNNLQEDIFDLEESIKQKSKNLLFLEEKLSKKGIEIEQKEDKLKELIAEYKKQEDELHIKNIAIKNKLIDIKKQQKISLELQLKIKKQKDKIVLQQKSIKTRDAKIENQRYFIYLSIGIIGLIILLAIFIYKNYRLKNKTNKILEKQKNEIEQQANDLTEKTEELQNTLDELVETQNHLLAAEKMATIGSLVAGVAHEINTPVGIGVTALSHLQLKYNEFVEKFKKGEVKKSYFMEFLNIVNESIEITYSNLNRAANLVQSFKQVSVDQMSEEKRFIYIEEYIKNIITNLTHEFKRTKIKIHVNCIQDFKIETYPGAISQIFTNLLMNAKIHAFDKNKEGEIIIDIEKNDKYVFFKISDNGKGIKPEIVNKIFDPFFTTKRNDGGSGLGLNIIQNIVVNNLNGNIQVKSIVNKGTIFDIKIPLK